MAPTTFDPVRPGREDLVLHCMATIDGQLWLGENPRERLPEGGTRSLGTRWTECLGRSTRATWKRGEDIVYARNCAERDRRGLGDAA